jgi:hypothetical protein
VILGHGRVGKTSAVNPIKQLDELKAKDGGGRQSRIHHTRSTVGMDSTTILMPPEKSGEKAVPLRIWDFAYVASRLLMSVRFRLLVTSLMTEDNWSTFLAIGIFSQREGLFSW